MGQIKSTELSNGNVGLEITYGGQDCPFGGVDTSAPPAYIDPKCFADCDGFIVVDNRLVAASYQPLAIPVLWGRVGASLLCFGTFYNSLTGQLNYALGYIATPFGVPGTSPTGVTYTFYMTSWDPANIAVFWNDSIEVTLFDALSTFGNASLTLGLITANQSALANGTGFQATVASVLVTGSQWYVYSITITNPGKGYALGDIVCLGQTTQQYVSGQTPPEPGYIYITVTGVNGTGGITAYTMYNGNYALTYPYLTGTVVYSDAVEAPSSLKLTISGTAGTTTYTVTGISFTTVQAISAMVTAINNGTGDPNVVAQASVDGLSVILVARIAGTSGDAITAQDVSVGYTTLLPPALYFSCRVAQNLEGGTLTAPTAASRTFSSAASAAEVGGTVYFANLGPLILKFSGPGSLAVSSVFQGVRTLRKFAGSLIGLGVISQLGSLTQNTDMILAWSAAGELDVWSAVTAAGNVTGAGFEQLADTGDALTSLIVSNGTAFILRAQGISYATATGNATLPFTVSHFGLGDQGEGCQIAALVSLYDQSGIYVGNSDVFQCAGKIVPIGAKIKNAIFNALQGLYPLLVSSNTCAVLIVDEFPLVLFLIGPTVYTYNSQNGTWQLFTIDTSGTWSTLQLGTLATLNELAGESLFNQTQQTLATATAIAPTTYAFYVLQECVPTTHSFPSTSSLSFPVEEISFGRDITIDALYIAIEADLVDNITVNFFFNTTAFSSLVLTPAMFVGTLPIEFQIFPTSTTTGGAFTVKSPQLEISLSQGQLTHVNKVHFTKVAFFASYDPKQRPV
jgi:hypothetical protein